ncbi:cell division protein [Basilea psittacipulmonis DSM 24701]|uniref:Cell division protein n=1 Tax=Basilea psittacipulmonis DSM 24701 TaxID=1072685 RepID=A0A077DBV0_9BURK|nr:cell division protein [Basilea psittacipulmonis DSM 24701]
MKEKIDKVKYRSQECHLIMLGAFVLVMMYFVYIQIWQRDLYVSQGNIRFLNTIEIPATRGKIIDANGDILASSIPVVSVWSDRSLTIGAPEEKLRALAKILDMKYSELQTKLLVKRNFIPIKRQVILEKKDEIKALKIPGIQFINESKRYYPQANLFAHMVGFTNMEGVGAEGIELRYEKDLQGTPGIKTVLRNRMGQIIDDPQNFEPEKNGQDIKLTVDSRIQYLVANILRDAIKEYDAASGGAIVIDVKTGHILAMVSLPDYNPNNLQERRGSKLRNRVITDVFEPGSIIKPLVAALALDSKAITTRTLFDTGNGRYVYQGSVITDVSRHNGVLDVAGIIRRSSNIGMTMISERLTAEQMWSVFNALGLGTTPSIAFPGAASGILRPWQKWRLIEKATMSYGYGLSVSLLQIAQAYTALARGGDMITVGLGPKDDHPSTVKVFSSEVSRQIIDMMAAAVSHEGGNNVQQYSPNYRIAGKSGTARKIVNKEYSKTDYRASFVAIAPVQHPKIVVAVTIDRPLKKNYYGSVVSGPVAAKIIDGTLRYLSVPPEPPEDKTSTATQ